VEEALATARRIWTDADPAEMPEDQTGASCEISDGKSVVTPPPGRPHEFLRI
jgi:hypothetical protein